MTPWWRGRPTMEGKTARGASFCPIPTMTPWWRGRPTMEGKTARGASSPAKPAFTIPEPLSTTNAVCSSSMMSYIVLYVVLHPVVDFQQQNDVVLVVLHYDVTGAGGRVDVPVLHKRDLVARVLLTGKSRSRRSLLAAAHVGRLVGGNVFK